MQERDDPISVCKLYEKTSRSGNHYFTGRWGNAKVLLFKSKEVSEDGSPIWDLKLAQAAPYQKKGDVSADVSFARDEGYEGPDVSNEGPSKQTFDDETRF